MQTHAYYLAKNLHEKGHRIEVMTYRSSDPETASEDKLFDRKLFYPIRRVLSRIGFWRNISLIEKEAEAFRPDLIYASNVFYGFLSDSLNIPVISRCAGNDVLRPWIAYPFRFASKFVSHPKFESVCYDWLKKTNFPEWIEGFFRKRRFALMRQSVMKSAMIVANSRYTAGLLMAVGYDAQKIRVLTGGVDTGRFRRSISHNGLLRKKLGLPPQAFIIMTACRLAPKKGIDFLLSSFKLLLNRIPNAHLIVVGEGKERKKCERLRKVLRLNGHVTFTGRIPHENIHEYFWASDMFVLTSRESINRLTGIKDVETMGRVLCEANASSTPAAASRSGGIPSVISHGKNGLLFTEEDRSDFLHQVLRIKNDRKLVRRIVEEGLMRAEKEFDWSVIVKKHEEIFAAMVLE
jgi:glycosyltransferase involved in cell wall biosynthesis